MEQHRVTAYTLLIAWAVFFFLTKGFYSLIDSIWFPYGGSARELVNLFDKGYLRVFMYATYWYLPLALLCRIFRVITPLSLILSALGLRATPEREESGN